MKQFFEEPNVFVERFSVNDQVLTVSWIAPDIDNDETNPVSPFGGAKAIG